MCRTSLQRHTASTPPTLTSTLCCAALSEGCPDGGEAARLAEYEAEVQQFGEVTKQHKANNEKVRSLCLCCHPLPASPWTDASRAAVTEVAQCFNA